MPKWMPHLTDLQKQQLFEAMFAKAINGNADMQKFIGQTLLDMVPATETIHTADPSLGLTWDEIMDELQRRQDAIDVQFSPVGDGAEPQRIGHDFDASAGEVTDNNGSTNSHQQTDLADAPMDSQQSHAQLFVKATQNETTDPDTADGLDESHEGGTENIEGNLGTPMHIRDDRACGGTSAHPANNEYYKSSNDAGYKCQSDLTYKSTTDLTTAINEAITNGQAIPMTREEIRAEQRKKFCRPVKEPG